MNGGNKTKKGKNQDNWDLQMTQFASAQKEPRFKCVGDSNVAEKWINGHCAMGQKNRGENWTYSENRAFMREKGNCVSSGTD